MNKVLQTLVDARYVEEADCDDILKQYRMYISDTVATKETDFSDFDCAKDRIDSFYFNTLGNNTKFTKL